MSALSLAVGQKIELNDGRVAVVRFVGTTSFQTGEWVGIELEEATGKNDGSVKGDRYFQCQPGHGMFLRASGVKQVLEQRRPKAVSNGVPAKRQSVAPTAVAGRVNGLKRQSVLDNSRKTSPTGTPTPSARPGISGIRSPVKSPTKQMVGTGASSSSTSRTNTPPAGRRTTMTTATATTRSRQSMLPPSATAARKPPTVPGTRPSTTQQRTTHPSLRPPSATAREPPARLKADARASDHSASAASEAADRRPPSISEDLDDEASSARSGAVTPEGSQPGASFVTDRTLANGDDADNLDNTITNFAPPAAPSEPPPSPDATRPRRPSSTAAASIHSQRTARSTTAANRQIEELEAKLRLLERKRQEDREVKKLMEQAQSERDQYKGIIEKLQNKYRPQQQEVTTLKQAVLDAEKRFADLEEMHADHDSALEMATLDREMAEETAEGLKAELDALRAHNEEVELEIEILREENGDLTKEMSPEERESAGWTQMQLSNDRLRNALLALRDRTADEKEELLQQIKALEGQVAEVDVVKDSYDETKERLLRSEADMHDLRQQLEVAQQADEIIEEMGERNGRLEDAVGDLRATIADLEDLKELNDELELNHMEAEKQMQEELDFKDSLLLDRERMAKQQQSALDDADHTITQFRQLVRQLQGDLNDLEASKQISQSEAKELEGKSRAMIDLNMKLQTSAAKTQVKTIDLELRKLDAQEASEHLDIVQLFLPEAFTSERTSVLALLRFKRIAFKANLVSGVVKERVASFGTRGSDEEVFAACDVLDKLTWVSGMSERFVNSICGCSVEEFAGYQSAFYELEPVERALNGYIDALRREDLREREMADELSRSIAVMAHLATLHVKDDLASHADELLMRTQCMQSQLETAATALQLSRSLVMKTIHAPDEADEADEGSASDLAIILHRADALANQARSAKVMVGKAHRSLFELKARSLTLDVRCDGVFDRTQTVTTEITDFTRIAGQALQALFGEEGRSEQVGITDVSSALSSVAGTAFNLQEPEAGPLTSLAARLRDLSEILSELASMPSDLDKTVEFERQPAPWLARANELNAIKATSIDTEAELARAIVTLRERDAIISAKETELEEQSVRVEMLEARMRDASKRSVRIAELEKEAQRARDDEARLRRQMETLRADTDREVEAVRAELGWRAEHAKRGGRSGAAAAAADLDAGAMGAVARLSLQRSEHKIASLESAVRWLAAENRRLHLPSPDAPIVEQHRFAWLHEPLRPSKTARQIRRENLVKEGGDVLQELLRLATAPPAVDLAVLPTENRLAWQPRKQSSRWKVEVAREEWEGLKEWRRRVVERGRRDADWPGATARRSKTDTLTA